MTNVFYLSLEEIIEHLEIVKDEIDFNEVEALINLILDAKKIFCYGAGRSGFIARCFTQRLMHIGLDAYYIGETITPGCGIGDLVVIVSGSGETASSVCMARKALELGAKIVAITANPKGTLASLAHHTLRVPGKTKLLERESYAPFTSLFDIAVLAVVDSISSELMRRLGRGEDYILKRHATLE